MTHALLIHNAVLWSDGVRLDGDSLLIRGDKIRAIGSKSDLIDQLRGEPYDHIDAEGGLVTPSFADAHIHAAFAGIEINGLDLTSADDARGCLELVAAFMQNTEGWIVGAGWEMPYFEGGTPTAEMLDAVTGDRPALIHNADHHGAWVNSAALRTAGIDASTPDPPDGRIERDSSGAPTGTLHEGAVALVAAHVPPPTTEAIADGILTAWDKLRAAGVTAWQEALIGDYAGFANPNGGYLHLLQQNVLPARTNGALWVPRSASLDSVDDLVAALVATRDQNAAQGYDTSTAKIMIDGVAENQTAALHEPYLVNGCDCGTNRGLAYFNRDVLFAVVAALATAGFALHFHAIGDRAVTDALDALEQLDDTIRAHRRHHIAHVQIIAPGDIDRFARLGVTVNAQALWACNEEQMTGLTVPIIGTRRAAWQYPFGSLERSGAQLAMGSDWPVSTYEPWAAIHVAVNRQAPGTSAPPLNPGEEISLATALTAYTAGSHDLLGLTGSGRLTPGANADICIASRNPFAGSRSHIAATRNCLTILRGEVVYGPSPRSATLDRMRRSTPQAASGEH